MDRQLSDFSDLELADITKQLYNELMQVQTNILGINQEIIRRKSKIQPAIIEGSK